MQFESVVNVPPRIQELVGKAMTGEALYLWWTTPLRAFNNRRPMDVWAGREPSASREDVVAFIQSAKSGDMA
jgi:hypothetical protein